MQTADIRYHVVLETIHTRRKLALLLRIGEVSPDVPDVSRSSASSVEAGARHRESSCLSVSRSEHQMPASPLGATAASQRSAAKSDWRLGFRSGGGHDQPEPSSSISTYSETWSFTHTHTQDFGRAVGGHHLGAWTRLWLALVEAVGSRLRRQSCAADADAEADAGARSSRQMAKQLTNSDESAQRRQSASTSRLDENLGLMRHKLKRQKKRRI